ncbi:hypothetical protein RYX56_14640 [Alkalihalophilus lindianensis]|uniref:Uncharacterized protein n=1 Tax=Alkalihalophilus lindianensis TaxID=1630542 RepID=A0ABU3XCI4_9BACI|nr:hypothetical protein [Alkalihalophilus lindianensis]MDV2685601.1 hypothetical protein [Alkalihalophilus lindianensis]
MRCVPLIYRRAVDDGACAGETYITSVKATNQMRELIVEGEG